MSFGLHFSGAAINKYFEVNTHDCHLPLLTFHQKKVVTVLLFCKVDLRNVEYSPFGWNEFVLNFSIFPSVRVLSLKKIA